MRGFALALVLLSGSPLCQAKGTNQSGTGQESAAFFRHGVTVNHWLGDNIAKTESDPEGLLYGATWFGEKDVAWIADHGFDHLRVTVNGSKWIDEHGKLIAGNLRPFENLLRWSAKHKVGVVLAMQGLPRFRSGDRYAEPPKNESSPFVDADTRARAADLWGKVALRFKPIGDRLRFELIAYPNANDAEGMRSYSNAAIAAIRKLDANRVVYVTTRNMKPQFANDLVLSDPHIAVALRMRDPSIFTMQIDPALPAIKFPGRVPDLSKLLPENDPLLTFSNTDLTIDGLEKTIDAFSADAKAAAKGHEIYIADFAAIGFAFDRPGPVPDDESARTYIRTVQRAFERQGFAWAVYDYHTGGAVRGDDGKGGPTRIWEGLDLKKSARR
jgi:hypothetical protein